VLTKTEPSNRFLHESAKGVSPETVSHYKSARFQVILAEPTQAGMLESAAIPVDPEALELPGNP
jgi:hypothetical protein